MDAINMISFKFFAIEFYESLFGLEYKSIPPFINLVYEFQNFTN